MKKKNFKPKIDDNNNPTLVKYRKQTRFGSENQIQGRNNLNNCLICGASFKRSDVVHKVVKSAKGVRLHLCSDCAKGYPTAQDYVKPSVRRIGSQICV